MMKLFFLIVFVFLNHQVVLSQIEQWQGNLAVKDGWAPFELIQTNNGDNLIWEIHNGKEIVKLDQIVRVKDSLFVAIPAFDTQIRAKVWRDSLTGRFLKNYVENDKGIEFKAYKGRARFDKLLIQNSVSIDGRWEIKFEGDEELNVGVFVQNGEEISGSVLSNSGDMRFLEGRTTGEGFVVSTFTGLSAYKLDVKVLNDTIWEGDYYNSKSKIHFTARYNPDASLENPYLLTRLKPGKNTLSIRLADLNGDTVDIRGEKYKGKVVIVSILGSWCPNCIDEQAFLSDWSKKYKEVEVIGLAFERKEDPVYAKKFLSNLRNRFDIGYPLLYAGKVGEESTKKVLPEIEAIKSYPTTIFISKEGKVVKIHTGFSGPATGLFYEEFQKEFNEIVESILQK